MSRASLSPGAEQDFERLDELALLARRCLRRARRCRRRQPLHRLARGGDVLLGPERVVVAHRLAPVSEREVRVGLLRFAEGLGREVELEVVVRLHAGEERTLRGRFGRRRKIDRAELAPGRRLRRDVPDRPGDHRKRSRQDEDETNSEQLGNSHLNPPTSAGGKGAPPFRGRGHSSPHYSDVSEAKLAGMRSRSGPRRRPAWKPSATSTIGESPTGSRRFDASHRTTDETGNWLIDRGQTRMDAG